MHSYVCEEFNSVTYVQAMLEFFNFQCHQFYRQHSRRNVFYLMPSIFNSPNDTVKKLPMGSLKESV